VKWHFQTMQRVQRLITEEAGKIAGVDLDNHRRDPFEAIDKGGYPNWRRMVQMLRDQGAETWSRRNGWNPFDMTKVRPHAD
jgi:catalase